MRYLRLAAECFGYLTITYLGLQWLGSYLDREDAAARRLGYYSSADQKEALSAGITQPAEWYNRKVATAKRLSEEAKAAENEQKLALERSATETKRQKAEQSLAEDRAKAQKEAECRKDLKCWGELGSSAASVYCKKEIEKLANYGVKWTDAWYEPKMSHFRWSHKDPNGIGIVTYLGDKAQFQNGFGAFQNITYTCDMLPGDKQHVIYDVSAVPGRLD